MGADDEANLSAEQQEPKADTRFSGEDEQPGRPEGVEAAPRQGTQTPDRHNSAQAAKVTEVRDFRVAPGGLAARSSNSAPGRLPRRTAKGQETDLEALCRPDLTIGRWRHANRYNDQPQDWSGAGAQPGTAARTRVLSAPPHPDARGGGHRDHCASGLFQAGLHFALRGTLKSSLGRLMGLRPRHLILAMIVAYQKLLSPFLPPCCRFHPSCSVYTAQAVRRYGVFRGIWLGLRRLLRCHPWNPGGFDPVP